MSEPRVIVWQDTQGSKKWLVAIRSESGRIENETPYDSEDDATAIAKTIGRSKCCPVYRASIRGEEELLQA